MASGIRMKIIVLVLFVIAILALLIVMRSKVRKPSSTAAQANKIRASKSSSVAPRNPFRATSIVFEPSACEAVKAIGNKRFLDRDRDVPSLPLSDCTVTNCNCKYAHHDDRRETSEDRRHPSALQSELYESSGKSNRRAKKRGRRKSDWA